MLIIYKRNNLFEHAAHMGQYLQDRLSEFNSHPLVGEVRGRGLIAAVELVANKETGEAFQDLTVGAYAKQACQDNGLLLRAVGGNSIAFCPPLIITTDQIDEMVDKFGRAIQKTYEYVQAEDLLRN